MESEPVIPCFRSWIWYYNTTTSAPELPSAKHTYKNILLEIAPDGVHSSPFATDDETHLRYREVLLPQVGTGEVFIREVMLEVARTFPTRSLD